MKEESVRPGYLQDNVAEGSGVAASPGGDPQGGGGGSHEEGEREAEATFPGVAGVGGLEGAIHNPSGNTQHQVATNTYRNNVCACVQQREEVLKTTSLDIKMKMMKKYTLLWGNSL